MSRHIGEFDWNEDRVARLRAMCAEGYSGGQIALAWGVTRNVVCAKIKRMGFKRGMPSELAKIAATIHEQRPSRAKPPKERKPKALKPTPTLAVPAKPRALLKDEAATETTVTSADIQRGQCYWPLNDGRPEWLHCGEQAVAGRSYCAAHLARGFSAGTRSEREAA